MTESNINYDFEDSDQSLSLEDNHICIPHLFENYLNSEKADNNKDIADEANIAIDKIANLQSILENKVDIVEGKQLSSNDYTDEEKSKLAHIEERAQVNLIEHIFLNSNETKIQLY